jgi:STE24 endopeptidase
MGWSRWGLGWQDRTSCAPGCAERLFLGGERLRRRNYSSRWRRSAEEVDLDLESLLGSRLADHDQRSLAGIEPLLPRIAELAPLARWAGAGANADEAEARPWDLWSGGARDRRGHRAGRARRSWGVDAAELFGEEQVARARSYHRPLYAAALVGFAINVVLLVLIVFGSLGGWLFEPFEGWAWSGQVVGFTALIVLLTTALTLPISFWAGFVRERSWGFSTQELPGFAADRVKGFLLGVVLSSAALLGLVGSARLLPHVWPLAAISAGAVAVLALGLLAPLVIEPIFNRFTPLDGGDLATELRALADRAQLPIKEVLVADASRRTRKANAYVSGLGSTRRLVLFDTLLAQAAPTEIGLVLAHELGHRRAHHLIKAALLCIVGLAGFVLVLWALPRWPGLRTAIGAPGGVSDPRVVPFVLLLAVRSWRFPRLRSAQHSRGAGSARPTASRSS